MPPKPPHTLLPRALQEPQFVKGLPFRMRTLLIATSVFIVFGSLIVFASALVVNQTKDELVNVAMDEVRQSAEQSRQRIQEIIQRQEERLGTQIHSLSEVAADPEIQAEMRVMSRSGAVLLSAIIDKEGTTVYQTFGNTEAMRKCPPKEGATFQTMLPPTDDGLTLDIVYREVPPDVMTERLPISNSGETIGYIEIGVEEKEALARLAPISQHITRSLLWMLVLVIICFGLAIYLLSLANSRYLELQRRHNQSAHLASIGTMASGLAHEIRNPLHAMNLHLDATREELEDPRPESPEIASKAIANVQRQIVNLSNILSNFMTYALPGKLEKEPVRIAPIVGEVANLMQPELTTRSIQLERDVPEDLWIDADQTAVRQVLTNVLLNAAQAVEKSDRREIRLRAQVEGSRCVITIDDSGPGLPEGAEENVFELFYSGRKGGSGFGLPIARRIMEEHDGSITGQSRKEGGARFTLVFHTAEAPKDLQAIPAVQTVG